MRRRIEVLLPAALLAAQSIGCAPTVVDASPYGDGRGNLEGRDGESNGTGGSGTGGPPTGTTATSGAGGDTCPPLSAIGLHQLNPEYSIAKYDLADGTLTDLLGVGGGEVEDNGAYDPATKRVYQLTGSGMVITDGISGTSTLAPSVPEGHWCDLVVNASGRLMALDCTTGELVILNTEMGTAEHVSDLPLSSLGYQWGKRAYNRATDRLYVFAMDFLLTVDGTTGAVLDEVAIDEWFDGPVVNGAGEILGVLEDPGVAYHTAKLDPATGVVTSLDTLIMAEEPGWNGSWFDPCSNHMYLLQDSHFFTIDATSGAVISARSIPHYELINAVLVW